jgi:hypothetical protein
VESHGDGDDDDDDDDDDDSGGWGKLTRPPELSNSLTSRVMWEQVGVMDEGVRMLPISI